MKKVGLLIGALIVVWVGTAQAAATCDGERYKAAGKYASCVGKAMAVRSNAVGINFYSSMLRCLTKYTSSWAKLQAKFPSAAPCNQNRYVDNGDGTVTDNLTGLTWEQKTNDGSIHDTDNLYTWTAGSTEANGDVFTTFLSSLNSSCFAGQCDWRIPTREELPMILTEACATSPCISESIFGPTQSNFYWTGSMGAASDLGPDYADLVYMVHFLNGSIEAYSKTFSRPVRAVRGGL